MMVTPSEKIHALALENHGYIRTGAVKENHISPKHLTTMVNDGILEKVRHGLYRVRDYEINEYESFIEASLSVPNGVICLISALDYYHLSTINPITIHMAVEHKAKITLPDNLNIKLYYMSQKYYETGIQQTVISGVSVAIYDKEKTICDCIRYRNKIGTDLITEAVKTYLKEKNRDITKLMKYAKLLKIEKTVNNYLEVLI